MDEKGNGAPLNKESESRWGLHRRRHFGGNWGPSATEGGDEGVPNQ